MGSVSAQQRQEMVDKFERAGGPDVFLISTMAGNMGINLVAANRVVLLDTSWNPANDRQALFRCFRFGQRKHVFIYRLVSMGVERVIYKRANQKELLAHRVVDDQQFQNIHKASHLEIRGDGDDTDNDDDGEDDDDALAQDGAFKRVIDRHARRTSSRSRRPTRSRSRTRNSTRTNCARPRMSASSAPRPRNRFAIQRERDHARARCQFSSS